MRPTVALTGLLLLLLTGATGAVDSDARPATLIKVVLTSPRPGEKNYGSLFIVVNLERATSQVLALEIQPKTKLLARSPQGNQRIWDYAQFLTVKPKTKYTLTLTSREPFLWHGKKTKRAQWSYSTAEAAVIHPRPPQVLAWSADDPVYTHKEHFRVEPPNAQEEKTGYLYVVGVEATFNAGVNGPPIGEQERRYRRELRAYTLEAVTWLMKNHVSPQDPAVRWVPREARDYLPKAKSTRVRAGRR